MEINEVEEVIRESIQKMQADGWTIRDRLILSYDTKLCCPLGAVGVVKGLEWPMITSNTTREVFRLGTVWSSMFICGFDGCNVGRHDGEDRPAFELGRKLREEFIKG